MDTQRIEDLTVADVLLQHIRQNATLPMAWSIEEDCDGLDKPWTLFFDHPNGEGRHEFPLCCKTPWPQVLTTIEIAEALYRDRENGKIGLPHTRRERPLMAEIPHIKVAHHHGATGDWMPDYASVVTRSVPVSGGSWSTFFLLPTGTQALSPADVILIPPGTEVLWDVISQLTFKALVVQGKLVFSSAKTTQIKVGTIQVYPTGELEIISGAVSQTRMIFTGPLNSEEDPEEFSLGLIANGGRIHIEGRPKQPYARCVSAKAGAQFVTVDNAGLWRQGDLVLFADTQTHVDPSSWQYTLNRIYLPQQFERRYIIGVDLSATPHTLRLDKPLQYAHTGWVANETRSITVRTHERNAQRGHLLFGGHGHVQVCNTTLYDLGRTTTGLLNSTYRKDGIVVPSHVEDDRNNPIPAAHNQIGRYPLHAHHLHEPVLFDGNVITGREISDPIRGRYIAGSPKWGIALHGSHGKICRNVVIGAEGAGIVTEAGNETGLIEDNLVIGTGGGEGNDTPAVGNCSEFVPALNLRVPQGGTVWGKSNQGTGYWFRGPYVAVRRNKAAGYLHSCGIEIWVHGKTVTIPNVPRLDEAGTPIFGIPDDGLAGTSQTTNGGTLLFEDNECHAITPEELGILYTHGKPIILRFKAQHRGGGAAIFIGWSKQVTFRDCTVRGEGKGKAIHANSATDPYEVQDCLIDGFVIV